MTSPDERRLGELKDLLRDLRRAGWRHSVRWVDYSGRDADGAPWGEATEVHHWTRDAERVEVFRDDGSLSVCINYDERADEGWDFDAVSVGHQWVERKGVSGLRSLADALGLLCSDGATA